MQGDLLTERPIHRLSCTKFGKSYLPYRPLSRLHPSLHLATTGKLRNSPTVGFPQRLYSFSYATQLFLILRFIIILVQTWGKYFTTAVGFFQRHQNIFPPYSYNIFHGEQPLNGVKPQLPHGHSGISQPHLEGRPGINSEPSNGSKRKRKMFADKDTP